MLFTLRGERETDRQTDRDRDKYKYLPNIFKVNNKYSSVMLSLLLTLNICVGVYRRSCIFSLLLTLKIFHTFLSVSIVEFEQ